MGIIRLYIRLRAWYVRIRGWSLCPVCDAVVKPPWVWTLQKWRRETQEWTLQTWCQECYHDLIEG